MPTREEIERMANAALKRIRHKLDMHVDTIADNVVEMALLAERECKRDLNRPIPPESRLLNLSLAIDTVYMKLKRMLNNGELLQRLLDKKGGDKV